MVNARRDSSPKGILKNSVREMLSVNVVGELTSTSAEPITPQPLAPFSAPLCCRRILAEKGPDVFSARNSDVGFDRSTEFPQTSNLTTPAMMLIVPVL